MPLRGTLSGVAPSPLVSRSVLPDAPRQLIRTFGAEKGRRFERNKKGPREMVCPPSSIHLKKPQRH